MCSKVNHLPLSFFFIVFPLWVFASHSLNSVAKLKWLKWKKISSHVRRNYNVAMII